MSLDLFYKKTNSSKPVVIYVHGGGWAIGDKANSPENKIQLFESLNYVYVSINYRLSPFPYKPNDLNRVKFPDHNNDVADAIKWVYDNIGDYGGNKNKIVLIGHSAGAQIVSLTVANYIFLTDKGLSLGILKGVAIIDTRGFDVVSLVDNYSNVQSMYVNAFGTDTLENFNASPLKLIQSGNYYPKHFITLRGSNQRKTDINEYITKLQNNNVAVTIVDGSEYTHDEINNAIGEKDETTITEPLIDFLEDCFN